ncbi:hypothetical protein [Virgibacillus proomii]|uniref:hypothetical protein n=1 Tax=Virgibacillus proomii TaxID=84407 RepID=UPI001C0F8E68|nr:hypothetical protein [Virgibacillus proomii]MBU5267463.1 hypothetical protein [Virgibacillus proomii]
MKAVYSGPALSNTPVKIIRRKKKEVLRIALAMNKLKADARRREKFQTIVADVENKKIYDILSDRKGDTINNYLHLVILEVWKSLF